MGRFGPTVKKIVILIFLILSVALSQIHINEAFPSLYFTKPLKLQYPPNESNRLFAVIEDGYRYVLKYPLVTNKSLFFDISDRIIFEGESLLFGMALYPEFVMIKINQPFENHNGGLINLMKYEKILLL